MTPSRPTAPGRLKSLVSALVFFLLTTPAWAAPSIGIYGLPRIGEGDAQVRIHSAGKTIDAVFVPADDRTIAYYRKNAKAVYHSVNVFGGTGAWQRYPDSRPVTADGTLLGSASQNPGYGGVCPTHGPWRRERLEAIAAIIREHPGIDGIWLDFIRYPGQWETADPQIEDTCYCDRCLGLFRASAYGAGFTGSFEDTAVKLAWMAFKKEQIASFVREARKILDSAPDGRKRILGLFTVPWRKGDFDGAVSFKLAQDTRQLSQWADVVSPMVYHRMVGALPDWVAEVTRYARLASDCEVRPIVQSVDILAGELRDALSAAGRAGADGVLVYSYKGMKSDAQWKALKAFKTPVNLIAPLPADATRKGPAPKGRWDPAADPAAQSRILTRNVDDFTIPSGVRPKAGTAVGITAGSDRAGVWRTALPSCEPGSEYVFTGYFYRDQWRNGQYPSLSFWGQTVELNTFLITDRFQPLTVYVDCPEKAENADGRRLTPMGADADGPAAVGRRRTAPPSPISGAGGDGPMNGFAFVNPIPGQTFWLAAPTLVKNPHPRAPGAPATAATHFKAPGSGSTPVTAPASSGFPGFFPIGVFGATLENLATIQSLGFNSVLFGGSPETVIKTARTAHSRGMNVMIAVPRDPERLTLFLEAIADAVRPGMTSFYVNDEPGIHSFPVHTAEDIQQLIKTRYPLAPTGMAVVRPQVCRQYRHSADFFMLDQYPVPFKPLSWLSGSMDRAADDVGRHRLMSIPQAFGGERFKDVGWPREPSALEMSALSYLSVIHGSRAVYFWSYSQIGNTEAGRANLGWAAGQLNRLQSWLMVPNSETPPMVTMVSEDCCDSRKKPAVHGCVKEKTGQMLLLAANTIERWVEAELAVPGVARGVWRDAFTGDAYPVVDGHIRVKFDPYQVRPMVLQK